MRVLVTGATGFFGRGIVEELRRRGHDVVGASRRPDGKFATVSLDVADPVSCDAAFASDAFEAVVHAAALAHVRPDSVDELACWRINALGAGNIAAASVAHGVRRFILISSVMVYGDHGLPHTVTEESPRCATGIYGRAKVHAEEQVSAVADSRMEGVILRPASMYAPDWLFNVRKRIAPPIVGRWFRFALDAETPRYSLCSLRNGVDAVAAGVEGRLPAGAYNVADDHIYTQAEIGRAVSRAEGWKPVLPVFGWMPRSLLWLTAVVAGDGPMLESMRSRYWKFCERNVYSSRKLAQAGVRVGADLIAAGDSVAADKVG